MSRFLIVGLGNMGEKYEKTYHNIGFLAVDNLAQKLSLTQKTLQLPIRWSFRKIRGIIYESQDVILAKPSCYMNESGGVVSSLVKHYAAPIDHLIIIHDDSDIILGNFKLKFGGSSGGHRGIESIVQSLGTQQFWRLKIGIRPEHEITRLKAERLVLKHVGEQETRTLEGAITIATQHLFQEFKIPYPSEIIKPL